ncbi:hypothetical protein CFP56_017791 [Quercus suber]|uniref:CASP-like protein n=1 Tax=Quercus suber TaxID=58331 RepID=A0AAW0KLZ6_QUESU
MGRNGEGESLARTSSSSSAINSNTNNTILRTRPDSFLIVIVCRCFSVITALTAILCITVNVLSAIRSFKDGSDVLSHSLSLAFLYVCVYVSHVDVDVDAVVVRCVLLLLLVSLFVLDDADALPIAASNFKEKINKKR